MAADLKVNDWLTLTGDTLQWRAVRSSGPGGQNVNKVATKVELRFDARACEQLPPAVRQRLLALAGRRLDTDGRILIVCSEGRSQSSNLETARQRLAVMIRRALVRPRARRETKPSRGARERRLKGKRERAETKASRGKVRE